MKVKVSLHDATKYLAAGLTVEHYLVIDGEEAEDEAAPRTKPKKRRRSSSILTHDESTYRLGLSKPTRVGTKKHLLYQLAEELVSKDPTKTFSRKQLMNKALQHMNKSLALSTIANMRDVGYLILVEA